MGAGYNEFFNDSIRNRFGNALLECIFITSLSDRINLS